MTNCEAPKCEQTAVYEIRVPHTNKPFRLCLKHGSEKKLELDAGLVTYQTISIGPRPISDSEALAMLRAAAQEHLTGPELASTQSTLRAADELNTRLSSSPMAAELEQAHADLKHANADRLSLRNTLDRVSMDRNEALGKLSASERERVRLADLLMVANERLKRLEVQPLTRVEGSPDANSPAAKLGGDAPAKPNVLGAPLQGGDVVGNNPPAKPAV